MPRTAEGWAKFILAVLAASFVISTVRNRVPAIDTILRGV